MNTTTVINIAIEAIVVLGLAIIVDGIWNATLNCWVDTKHSLLPKVQEVIIQPEAVVEAVEPIVSQPVIEEITQLVNTSLKSAKKPRKTATKKTQLVENKEVKKETKTHKAKTPKKNVDKAA